MAYVYEKISNEDYVKNSYLREMRTYYGGGWWIIDRKKEMWLKNCVEKWHDRDDCDTAWGFYYKGYLVFIKTEEIKGRYEYIRFLKMYCPFKKYYHPELPQLPQELEDKKEEILKEFKKAYEGFLSCHPFYKSLKIHKISLEYNGKMI